MEQEKCRVFRNSIFNIIYDIDLLFDSILCITNNDSFTKNLVEIMGGTISVSSEEGKGSEFTVTLQFKKSATKVVYERIPEKQGQLHFVRSRYLCLNFEKHLL